MLKKSLLALLAVTLCVLAVVLWQFLFPPAAVLDDFGDYGPAPELVAPVTTLVPTVRPAKAVGWPDGESPSVPDGLAINLFADGLDHPRWLYALPNGDVLVAESNAPEGSGLCSRMKNLAASVVLQYGGARTPSADRVTLLRDTDADGASDESHVFADGLHSPFGMALVGNDLYIANADAVLRFDYVSGRTRLAGPGEVITALPAGKNHHWTKNILPAPDGRSLFVTVGSNSNVGECGPEAEVDRAAIHRLDLATGELTRFAHGLRNPNGLAFEPETGVLWTAVNERDELGSDLVPDYVTSVHEGDFFGWPYSYYGDHPQPGLDARWTAEPPAARSPDYAVGAHTASLDVLFARDSALPERWQSGLIVSQHGSWNRHPRAGYRVIFIPFENGGPAGMPAELVGGLLDADGNARGRPAGLALDATGALLVADDVGNVVWRVSESAR
ncbi:MAG: sorbosone dehydrogenase family protein [Woeseiaceae bacterium]|nr:sorbosone dehydrogenase family protein [Woeseiaceae bacterium]